MHILFGEKKRAAFIIGIFFFLFFWIVASQTLDSDFGFHVRLGQLIVTKGIPYFDPFSYTMPSYPFVDHEWLTDILISFGYQTVGIPVLTIFFVLLSMVAFGIQFIFAKSKWAILPFVLSMGAVVNYLGIRPQVFSWVLFSVFLVVLLSENLWHRLRFLLPVLLLLWVNVHGSFALGLVAVFLFVLARSLQHKKIVWSEWAVVFFCLLATFVNPYGFRVWWEIWMQMTDSNLHFAIGEWLPAFFVFNLDFLMLVVLSLVLLFRYLRKYSYAEVSLYILLLALGIDSNRHIPFWLLLVIPVAAKGLAFFYKDIQEISFAQKRLLRAYFLITVCVTGILSYQFIQASFYRFYSPQLPYPERAIGFLKQHPSPGNYFAEYVFGGYLDWQLPEKKVFIDGRMPSWRRSSAPSGESLNAFADYDKIMSADSNLPYEFMKYHIDTVLLTGEHNGKLTDFFDSLSPQLADTSKQRLEKRLEHMGMKVVYKDNFYMIYRKK